MDFLKIYRCYSTDSEHIEKDHEKAGLGIRECVKHTAKVLKNDEAKIYEIISGTNIVGLYSKTKDNVLQFWFIYPKYRSHWFCKYFWLKLKKDFDNIVYTAVSTKNEKALKHLLLNNFEIVNKKENIIFLKCQ